MTEAGSVPSDKILVALEELSMWTEKRDRLRSGLREVPTELRDLKRQELDMAERHVKYYTALARDMKRSTHPPKLGQFIDSLALL